MEGFPSGASDDRRSSSTATGGGADPDDWVMHTDPQGKKYFFSEFRKTSIWADQRPDIKPNDDVEVHQTSDGRVYVPCRAASMCWCYE